MSSIDIGSIEKAMLIRYVNYGWCGGKLTIKPKIVVLFEMKESFSNST